MDPKYSKLDVVARLNEFRDLKVGWLNGDGKTFDGAALDKLIELFMLHYLADPPLPYTFSTEDAGVQFAWRIGYAILNLEIDLTTFQGEWLSGDDEAILDMSTAAGWADLVARVTAIVRPSRKRSRNGKHGRGRDGKRTPCVLPVDQRRP